MFKNALIYRLPKGFTLPDNLEELLAGKPFRKCSPTAMTSVGWEYPLSGANAFTHAVGGVVALYRQLQEQNAFTRAVGGCVLLCARKQERIIPSAAVKEAVNDKLNEALIEDPGFVASARWRREMKNHVINALLPKTLTKSKRICLYVDTKNGWLVVDSSSQKQADEVLALLRMTLGTLPASVLQWCVCVHHALTRWVSDAPPLGFSIGSACELSDSAGEVVRCKGMDLSSDEVQEHINAGKEVNKIELIYDEAMSFVLDADLGMKRIKMLSDCELNGDETSAQRLDADFALFSGIMRELLGRFVDIFEIIEIVDVK